MQRKIRSDIFLPIFFLLCVFLLALTKTRDYDAWIHLTFGRVIWENRGLPAFDPFLPPMAGKPFSYSSWLFGVIYYLVYRLLSVYGIVLLKASSITVAFFILFKDSLIPYGKKAFAILALITVAVFMSPRFVERPETFLFIFLSFSIFSLNAYLYEGKKTGLYCLPLVHLLWANSHSSINVMVVPFIAFLAGGTIHLLLEKNGFTPASSPTTAQLKTIGLVFLISIIAIFITPYGVNQLLFGAEFLKSDLFKQEIVELHPPTWETFSWYYIFLGMLALSFTLSFRRFSFIDFFLIIPFVYVSLSVSRFVYILAIVASPVLVRNISAFAASLQNQRLVSSSPGAIAGKTAVLTFAWLLVCTTLAIGKVPPFEKNAAKFGFGFDLSQEPEGALSYLDKRNITGTVNSLFQWGQYIEWRDFPKRKPLIDGRGYVPATFMKGSLVPSVNHNAFFTTYGADIILTSYPTNVEEMSVIDYDRDVVLADPAWALVYWDDTSLVYLRRGGKYDAIIQKDEYRVVKPANNMENVRLDAWDSQKRRQFISELERNRAETNSSCANAYLGWALSSQGLYAQAIESFAKVKDPKFLSMAYAGTGNAYAKLNDQSQSLLYFKKALKASESASLHWRVGLSYFNSGEFTQSISHLKKAIEMKKNLIVAYPPLISAYQRSGQMELADQVAKEYAVARQSSTAEQHFIAGVNAYSRKQLAVAASEFEQSILADSSNPSPHVNLGFVSLDLGQADKAFDSFRRALALDSGNALAHYGLAMIYKRRGDNGSARNHWSRYLQIEPAGIYSRRVKEELQKL